MAVIYANNLCQMSKLARSPPTNWVKMRKWAFTPPPRKTQAGQYEVTIPIPPPPTPHHYALGGEWGFQMTGALESIEAFEKKLITRDLI